MRHALTILAVSLLIQALACVTVISGPGGGQSGGASGASAGGETSTATTSTETVPPGCDESGDCGACIDCVVDGECADETAVCVASDECLGLLDCLAACPNDDDICLGTCYNAFSPEAADLVIDFRVCIDCACPVSCQTGC